MEQDSTLIPTLNPLQPQSVPSLVLSPAVRGAPVCISRGREAPREARSSLLPPGHGKGV